MAMPAPAREAPTAPAVTPAVTPAKPAAPSTGARRPVQPRIAPQRPAQLLQRFAPANDAFPLEDDDTATLQDF
jgi:hypothetical protein